MAAAQGAAAVVREVAAVVREGLRQPVRTGSLTW